MVTSELERTYFFNGGFLSVATYLRDQRYVRDLVQYQNSHLYSLGVVDGLAASAEGASLEISPGMAIDSQGRSLFVTDALSMDMSSQSLIAGKVYYVVLEYSDSILSGSSIQELQTTQTITESPKLGKLSVNKPTKQSGGVGLCSFKIDSSGKVGSIVQSDEAGRVLATLNLQLTSHPSSALSDLTQSATQANPDALGDPKSDRTPMPSDQSLNGFLLKTVKDMAERIKALEDKVGQL